VSCNDVQYEQNSSCSHYFVTQSARVTNARWKLTAKKLRKTASNDATKNQQVKQLLKRLQSSIKTTPKSLPK